MTPFTPRIRKHKKIARLQKDSPSTTNSNADIMIPEPQAEKEARKDAIRQNIHPEGPVSSKKRKRLEKYIETKLKKDENAELIRKLAGQKVDTSLLQSSKKLGRVTESQRERLQRALKEREAGISAVNGYNGDSVLFQRGKDVDPHLEEEESDEEEAEEIVSENGMNGTENGQERQKVFGSGLKRPLEVGEDGQPMLKKRKKRRRTKTQHLQSEAEDSSSLQQHVSDSSPEVTGEDEEEWNGFTSEDDADLSDSTSNEAASQHASTSEEDSDGADEPQTEDEGRPRISAFKQWADTLRNAAAGFTPSSNVKNDFTVPTATVKPRTLSPDFLLSSVPTSTSTKPPSAITIPRSPEIEASRLELPVVREEQNIVEAINLNPVTVICGATGSGKTTQIPQMLLESGYGSRIGSEAISAIESTSSPRSNGMIGVTQPRRVAATSVAARVQYELGSEKSEFGRRVAHQVRYDTRVSRDTAIKYMTDGILLREIQQDFLLSRYSVIVLDEAHERSVNTDILIGMLARIVPLRAELSKEEPEKHYPLKFVIMSATLSHETDSFLRNEKLWKPFAGPPPVVEIEGRQFSVTVHFSRRTRRDYVDEIVEKVARGHRKLPAGGMLVFLTGQQEIQTVAKRLRERLGGARMVNGYGADARDDAADVDDYEDDRVGLNVQHEYLEGEEGDPSNPDPEPEIKLDDNDAEFAIEDDPSTSGPWNGPKAPLKPHILPLYAALPQNQQLRVFQPEPEGHRLIVLATNVAETSLTIPGIRYVFDSGRAKEKKYNTPTGVQTFEVDWISKASAEQRKGRAGRTRPGHVWRLYSSNVYEESFADHTVPEILRTPLESVVLQLKNMDFGNIANFPFPTPPEKGMLDKAEVLLTNLGAIDSEKQDVTDVGREIMKFPVSPRFGKMLHLARMNKLVPFSVAVVAGLAVGEIFVPEIHASIGRVEDEHNREDEDNESDTPAVQGQAAKAEKEVSDKQHQSYTRAQVALSAWDDRSDVIKLVTAIAAYSGDRQKEGGAAAFCKKYWLREKGMAEVLLLRRQLHAITMNHDQANGQFEEKLSLPTDKEITMLNQIVAAGFVDQVAIRADAQNNGTEALARKPRRAIEVPYRTLLPSSSSPEDSEDPNVYLHPSSVLAKFSPKEMPTYIVYSHLSRAAQPTISDQQTAKKTRMHPLTVIGPKALAVLAEGTPLLHYGKPVGKIEDLPSSGGLRGGKRRQCWVGVTLKAPVMSGEEWDLDVRKVVQLLRNGAWVVEKVVAR